MCCMCCEKKTMIGWRNVWSMKCCLPGQEVDQRKLGERLCKECQARGLNREDAMDCSRSGCLQIYKFNRTNFQDISRRFQEGFQEKSRTCLRCFGLLCNVLNLLDLMEHVMMSSNQRSSLCYSTDYNISYIFNIALLNVQWHIIIIKAISGIHTIKS